MGRPIHKKYFGNRNIGTNGYQITGNNSNNQNYADDRIGGEGVASYGTIVAGTGWTQDPVPYFSNPDIAGGVTVAGVVHYKALAFSTTANGSSYSNGTIVQVDTGTAATKARATVASIITRATPTINNGGTLYDVVGDVGDRVTFTHADLSQPLVVEITSVDGGGVAQGLYVVTPGIWTGAGAPSSTAGWTATTSDGPLDNNGSGLELQIGAAWGVYSFGAVTVAGDYTAFPSTGVDGTVTTISGSGAGATADITMGLLSVVVTQKGSGYTSPADAELLFDEGANGASAVAVLTVDTGAVGSATNQENAIVAYAFIDGGREIVDIIKQTAARRYTVKGADGISKKAKLVSQASNHDGMVDITATDDEGKEYWVTKLTSHKALLTRKDGSGGYVYATGQTAPWSFTSTANGRVIIQNA